MNDTERFVNTVPNETGVVPDEVCTAAKEFGGFLLQINTITILLLWLVRFVP